MRIRNVLSNILLSSIIFIIMFSPFLEVNNALIRGISLLNFKDNSLFATFVLLLFLGEIAISTLTYTKVSPSIKFLITLCVFIYTCLFFSIVKSSNFEFDVGAGPGYVLLLGINVIITLVASRNFFEHNSLLINDIVEIAIFVSMSIALDLPFCKIHIGQNGGSISLTMLPLIFYAIKAGPVKGTIASGIVYGLITCLFDGYGFASYPFDYLLAYGSIGLVGLFSKQIKSQKTFISPLFFVISLILTGIGRTTFSTISGVLIWKFNWLDSFVYNAPYIWISVAGCTVVGLLMLPIFLSLMKKYTRN